MPELEEIELRLHRRVCRIIAEDGLPGLFSPIKRRFMERFGLAALAARKAEERSSSVRATYLQNREVFLREAQARGLGDLSQYYWYHTIDLGGGLVTPGDYDYRSVISQFGFPSDMSKMKVLDVGSATGYFAFEFEKRGAEVVSVELPSIADWDMPRGEERAAVLKDLMEYHRVSTIEDLQHFHLDAPFELCRKQLGSKVTRVHSTVYQLNDGRFGPQEFDMVFCGDILCHTFSPFKALVELAPLCKSLVVSQALPTVVRDSPVMHYCGGDKPMDDCRSWFAPNRRCMEHMLKRLGFRRVEEMGSHTGYIHREGATYPRRFVLKGSCN